MTSTGHWRLAISTLSPLHMGSGEDYEPSGYVIDEGALYAFDSTAALDVLPTGERARLEKIVMSSGEAGLRDLQKLFHDNHERMMAISQRQLRVPDEVERFYRERIGQTAQQERGGRRVINQLQIERTAYNPPSGKAILPGSGLKGAIRTALLDAVNNGAALPTDLRHNNRANQPFQKRLFKGNFETDPLRLVQLADAGVHTEVEVSTEVVFAVNRKKESVVVNNVERRSQAEDNGLYQLLECISGPAPRTFCSSIAVQANPAPGDRRCPGMAFSLREIALACNRFYRPILEGELALLRKRGFLSEAWEARLRSWLDGPLKESLDNNRAFLLRVGRHSGAESVTLSGVRNIKIRKGKEAPETLDHAKTLWLAGRSPASNADLLPFGWLLIEPYQNERELTSLPLEDSSPELKAWRAKVRARVAEQQDRLEAERQREAVRQEAERQAQAQAEARALEEARQREEAERTRAERLAAMGPVERRMAELADGDPQVQEITVLVNALKQGEWEGDEAVEAARIIRGKMTAAGSWREQSAKKKPDKDKPYQQTLIVKRFL